MLVKCKCHGIKIDRDMAYKVVVKGKNHYYCSESDYINIQREKESRIKVLKVVEEIIGKTTNTILFKELKKIAEIHTYYKLLNYLNENKNILMKNMNKNFTNEFGKIKYFSTIIKNNLGDYETKTEIKKYDKNNTEYISIRYKARKRKKSLNEYLDEYLKEE